METKITTFNISDKEYHKLLIAANNWKKVVSAFEEYTDLTKKVKESDLSFMNTTRELRAVTNEFLDIIGMEVRFWKEDEHDH